jgi:hypothetical protein
MRIGTERSLPRTLALACALALYTVPAHALQIEWQVEPGRASGGRIVGEIRNDDRRGMANLRIRADRVAPDGTVLATYRAWAPGTLTFEQRVHFEVSVPEPSASYRVSVESFDFFGCD